MAKNHKIYIGDCIMIKKNKVKNSFRSGKAAFGCWIKSSSPKIVEITGLLGLDYIIIDNEHGSNDELTLENLIRVSDLSGVTPFVRVGENRPIIILKALDAGARGVIVPHIDTQEDAKKAVEAVKFAPEGIRGSAMAVRSHGYGLIDIPNYHELENNETMVILMIESASAIENIKEIAATKGIDVLHIGPSDLAQSMGLTSQTNHPLVQEAVEKVLKAGKEAKVAVGISAKDATAAQKRVQQGFLFVPIGKNDLNLFGTACRQILNELK